MASGGASLRRARGPLVEIPNSAMAKTRMSTLEYGGREVLSADLDGIEEECSGLEGGRSGVWRMREEDDARPTTLTSTLLTHLSTLHSS
jgi:hypothetical protein